MVYEDIEDDIDVETFKKDVSQNKDLLKANNIKISFNADFEKLKTVLLVSFMVIVVILLVIVYFGYSGYFKSNISLNSSCPNIPECPKFPNCPACSPSINCGNVALNVVNGSSMTCINASYGMNFSRDTYLCSNPYTLSNFSVLPLCPVLPNITEYNCTEVQNV